MNRRPHQATRAFTLMEVMLALAVSAIVLAGIGGVFFSAMRLRERTNAMLDEAMPLQQALGFLRRDLRGALPPSGTYALAGDFKIEPANRGVSESFRLHCFTSSGVIRDDDDVIGGDVQEVIYELRDSTDGKKRGQELVRSVNRNVLSSGIVVPEEQSLLENVQSLEFAGYDGTDWRDSWDTSLANTNLPSAVRVRIQLARENNSGTRKDEPYELVVPLVVVSRTNQVQTSTGATQ